MGDGLHSAALLLWPQILIHHIVQQLCSVIISLLSSKLMMTLYNCCNTARYHVFS